MADEFQGRINCGESWCAIDVGGFGWSNDHLLDMKMIRSSGESASASDGSVLLKDVEKPQLLNSENGTSNSNISMESTLQMMNNGLSTSTTTSEWNQALFQSHAISEGNYSSMLQEDLNSSMNYRQQSGMDCPQMQKQWNPKSYANVSDQHYSTNIFKPVNQCFASYTYPSNLQQNLCDTTPQPQKSLFENLSMNNFAPTTSNYLTSVNNFSPPLPKFSPMLKQQSPIAAQLQFSNNTSLLNASAAALNEIRESLLPSSTVGDKLNRPNLTAKPNNEVAARKTNDEPAFKRQRIETPSPLPTFKVRKEKLGDRITALQQLVSPFGKTDTASVLHEAIEYIKFLHDQVSVLSTPYLKNGPSHDIQGQQAGDKLEDQDGPTQDLRSRGLCLVPISSTFPVATETTTDFWAPTFGGAFIRQKEEAIQHLRTQLISY